MKKTVSISIDGDFLEALKNEAWKRKLSLSLYIEKSLRANRPPTSNISVEDYGAVPVDKAIHPAAAVEIGKPAEKGDELTSDDIKMLKEAQERIKLNNSVKVNEAMNGLTNIPRTSNL